MSNPSFNVSHVVSLTVPTKTAPAGSNPFEDDEDEEEEAAETEQQTTVNHISVNKEEEIKTLVNKEKTPAKTFSPLPLLSVCYVVVDVHSFIPPPSRLLFLLSLLALSSSSHPSLLLQVAGCCVALHGRWNGIACV